MECIFALAAAIIPCLLSSNTKQFSGFTSNLSAAAKKTSGAGFDLYPSLEDTITFGLNTKPACDKNFLISCGCELEATREFDTPFHN